MNITYKLREIDGNIYEINPQLKISTDILFAVDDDTAYKTEEDTATEQMRQFICLIDGFATELLSVQPYYTAEEFIAALKAAALFGIKWETRRFSFNEVRCWLKELEVVVDWNEIFAEPVQEQLRWSKENKIW